MQLFSNQDTVTEVSIRGGGHYCKGSHIVLLCKAVGNNLSYQWIKDDNKIEDSDNPAYEIDSADYSNSGIYKCIISNSTTTSESSSELVYIDNETGFIDEPSDNYTCLNKSVTFEAQANIGPDGTYQWYKNNEQLTDLQGKYSGTKSSILTINNVTDEDTTFTYWCRATGNCNVAESNKAKFVLIDFDLQYQTTDTSVCWDNSLYIVVTPKANTDKAKFRYQWYKDEEPIEGATNSTYSKLNSRLVDEGTYYCLITEIKTNYSGKSQNIRVKINQAPVEISNNFYNEFNQIENKPFVFYVSYPNWIVVDRIEWYCNDTIMPEFNNIKKLMVFKGDKSIAGTTLDDDYFIDYQAVFYCKLYNECGFYQTPKTTLTFVPEDKIYTLSNNNSISEYYLSEPNPNPITESSIISFSIPKSGNVKISLYNSLGDRIADLTDEYLFYGSYTLTFDTKKFNLIKGLYFYTMTSGQISVTKKLIIQ